MRVTKAMLEETNEFLLKSNIIFISIGGNDIKDLLDNENITIALDYDELISAYLSDIEGILNEIKSSNEEAYIVMIGLYNPFGDRVSIERLSILFDMNYRTSLFLSSYPNSVYIPTYDLFKYNLDSYLTFDEFHPSALGYNAIVERISVVLKGLMK